MSEKDLVQRVTTLEEELSSLKAMLDTKDAEVSGLTNVLSMVVLAEVARHNDGGLPKEMRIQLDSDFERGRKGGTQHLSANYFFKRGELIYNLLEGLTGTSFLFNFWRRSIFPWIDERRHQHLRRIEAGLERCLDLDRHLNENE